MQATKLKGAKDATTKSATVAKKRAGDAGHAKAGNAKRQSTAYVSAGAQPVRYRFERGERGEILPRTLPSDASAKEQRAAVYTPADYSGPSIKALIRLAVLGLFLLGFVIGTVVGRVFL